MKQLIYVFLLGIIFLFVACTRGEDCSEEVASPTFGLTEEKSKSGSCCASSIANDSLETDNSH